MALRLHALLARDGVVADLRRYYGIGLPPGTAPYTGARFEQLAGGGDRPGTADRFTADDLIAVQTLSVTVPAPVALDLLEGPLGERLHTLLRAVPADLDLVDADAGHISVGSPAARAWELLDDAPGVGWVLAGKLLARKRPRLLPVYDRVVRCALGRPSGFWSALHAALRADGGALAHRLAELHWAAELPPAVSALRVCDVAVWTSHHADGHPCPY
ncbi:DUF6308 family protein [Kitasatospora phosalacinea]|uniref:DUF6308 family protein n=1 Tax=Kitasatospora phosalacinea TaxID=2065 RepID=UPI0007C6C928|nr:DUF6308 family protein [Kitasatospora phosalacinea]